VGPASAMLHLLLPGWLASAICMQAADRVPDQQSWTGGDPNCSLSCHLQHGSSVWCGCVLLLCERGAQPPAERADDRSSVCRLQRPVLPGVYECPQDSSGSPHQHRELGSAAAGLAVCLAGITGAWHARVASQASRIVAAAAVVVVVVVPCRSAKPSSRSTRTWSMCRASSCSGAWGCR
jgi:hypothetical protein